MTIAEKIAAAKNVKNSVLLVGPKGYFPAVRNNRFGPDVIDIPGGSADLLASKHGRTVTFELGKDKQIRDALHSLHLTVDSVLTGLDLEIATADALQNNGWYVSLTSPEQAATQELFEEVGINVADLCGTAILEKSMPVLLPTKRGLGAIGTQLDLAGVRDLQGLDTVIERARDSGVQETKVILYTMGPVDFADLPAGTLRHTDKVDEKSGRLDANGQSQGFYEAGTVTNIEGWGSTLEIALKQAQYAQMQGDYHPAVAVVASYAQMLAVKECIAAIQR